MQLIFSLRSDKAIIPAEAVQDIFLTEIETIQKICGD